MHLCRLEFLESREYLAADPFLAAGINQALVEAALADQNGDGSVNAADYVIARDAGRQDALEAFTARYGDSAPLPGIATETKLARLPESLLGESVSPAAVEEVFNSLGVSVIRHLGTPGHALVDFPNGGLSDDALALLAVAELDAEGDYLRSYEGIETRGLSPSDVFESLKDGVEGIISGAGQIVSEAWEGAGDVLGGAVDLLNGPADAIRDAVDQLGGSFGAGFDSIESLIGSFANNPIDAVADITSDAAKDILSGRLPDFPGISDALTLGTDVLSATEGAFQQIVTELVSAGSQFASRFQGFLETWLSVDLGPQWTSTGCGVEYFGLWLVPDKIGPIDLTQACATHDANFNLFAPPGVNAVDNFIDNMVSNGVFFVDVFEAAVATGDPVAIAMAPGLATVYTAGVTAGALVGFGLDSANQAGDAAAQTLRNDRSAVPLAVASGIVEGSIGSFLSVPGSFADMPAAYRPASPTDLSLVSVGRNEVVVRFTDNAYFEKRHIAEVSVDGQTNWSRLENIPPNAERAKLEGLNAGTGYWIRIVAEGQTGRLSAPSNAVYLETDPPLIVLPSWLSSSGGVYSIRGGSGNDSVSLVRSGDNVKVTFNNQVAYVPHAIIKSWDIRLGAGDDFFENYGFVRPALVFMGEGADVAYAREGRQDLRMGKNGDIIYSIDSSLTNDSFNGGDGRNDEIIGAGSSEIVAW
ncbi:fibronectin type III domain-containing protein [Botrimarina sp.]|uniref:fibronectin type III domain-containing protein n=1 Tax=Botrimarina sp. TaxID=2795802 RepID=UPI0032EE21C1